MGSFLRTTPRARTRVYLPPVIAHDCDYEVVVSQEARDAGQVWIEVDGKRVVTIERDGSVKLLLEEESKAKIETIKEEFREPRPEWVARHQNEPPTIDYERDWAGECRVDPRDGNGYVLRKIEPSGVIDGYVVLVNDVLGGHATRVGLDEWLGWEKA